MCVELISNGANTNWVDDIGNSPVETMLDSALVFTAMSGGSWREFGRHCGEIGPLFGMSLAETGNDYLRSRGFSEIHQVLLRIDHRKSLEDFLRSSDRRLLKNTINLPDNRGRTPLMWAVEFGWPDATQTLLKYGANLNLQVNLQSGATTTLLHVAVAGPVSQFLRDAFREVVDILIKRGINTNARDHEGWTALHIVASWGNYQLKSLIENPDLDWKAQTGAGQSVDDLSPVAQFSAVALGTMNQG